MDETVRFGLQECYKTLTEGWINLVEQQTSAISAHPASWKNYSTWQGGPPY